MLALSFLAASNRVHGFLVMQLPQFLADLIQSAGLQQKLRCFLGENDAAHGIVAQHHVNRLFGIKHLFELALEIGNGDEFGQHRFYRK